MNKIYLYEDLTLEELSADKWLREIVRRGEIDGREYRIYTNGFFPTAYIEATPKEIHEYRDSGGIVHGGFTFDGELEGSDKRWLGWDYGHVDDYVQFYNRLGYPMELHKWTADEIMGDVESAAKALAGTNNKEK